MIVGSPGTISAGKRCSDIVNDQEELNPIPLENLTDDQAAIYELFNKAIKSMPETNAAYQKKTEKTGSE